ncbi:hypothetical protein [Motilibacter aurantiacus]|uniref:hypothetical protein n=1 Tax=Motilibacter aurantiacus TaxID=2714955 RepID=UPI00140A9217|nr:hypothetical protein [Motilibacter aurantiacus]NHC47258.1 hypothetical protein [Motilibacter aurantiacus]
MAAQPVAPPRAARLAPLVGLLAFVVLGSCLLLWAKWSPYVAKTQSLSAGGGWPGSSLLATAGVEPGSAPSWAAATSFTRAYADAVWKAVVAGLLIAAAVQSLVPRAWLLRAMSRRSPAASAVVGGLVSTPSMMCSC